MFMHLHNITLSRRTTTVCSNDTLVDTPFQLISGFFHVNQGILCSEHAEQASSRGVLERGGATTGSGLKPIRLQVYTLVDTPFQLISGFFHVNQGILCSEHAEQASSRGVLEGGGGGGGGNRLAT